MDWTVGISVLVFLVMLFAMTGIYSYLQSREKKKEWGDRLKGRSQRRASSQTDEGLTHITGNFVRVLERLGEANKPKTQAETSMLRQNLVTAGYRSRRAPVIFTGTKVFLALLLGMIFLVFGSKLTENKPASYFAAGLITCAVAGFYGPQVWLRLVTDRRKGRLVNGFPDALDLLVVCVEAGLGLDQAIAKVGEEIRIGHKDLSDEFQLMGLELRAGLTREQALRNLINRTDVEEIRSLVALLIQTDRFGTSIGQALRVHSDSMRTNRRLRAEEMAAKLPVKLMLPLIMCVFPAIGIVIMGPGVILLMKKVFPVMSGGG